MVRLLTMAQNHQIHWENYMKLLKITLAVVAASTIYSAVFADANVEYQYAKSSAPAEVTYNGQTIFTGQTVLQDISGGHTAVFKASAGLDIYEVTLPCALNNSLWVGDAGATDIKANQVWLDNSDISVKAAGSDVVTAYYTNPCSTVADGSTLVADGDKTKNVTSIVTGAPVEEVSYKVTPNEYTGADAAVAGTYRGIVTIKTQAD